MEADVSGFNGKRAKAATLTRKARLLAVDAVWGGLVSGGEFPSIGESRVRAICAATNNPKI